MPVSPQLALRVAILGGVAMAMFAVIFFRLWYLQVLSGEQYVQQAERQPRARPADRRRRAGRSSTAEGQPIVSSRTTNAVQIVPSALPPRGRAAARALPAPRAPARDERRRASRRSWYTGARPLPLRAGDDQDRRRAGRADGARRAPERIPGRRPAAGLDPRLPATAKWPRRCSATSARSPKRELKLRAFRGVQQGTVVGQEGLEYYYDRYLRGEAGRRARRGQRRRLPGPEPPRPDAAAGRPQPQGDARPRPAERERKGAAGRDRTRARRGQTGERRRVRGDRPAQRADPLDRLLPELRPEQVRQTADQGGIRTAPGQRHRRRSADRPRRQRHLSDRLDVQADHRDGGARSGRARPERRARGRVSASRSRPSSSATPATPTTARSAWSTR